MSAPPVRLTAPLPARRPFSLTPLADALFQVLVFFMLSGSLASYASLPLRNAALATRGGAGTPTPDPTVEAARTAVWTIGASRITANGQRFGFDRLPALAQALKAQQTPNVLLIARPGARVQDMVDVLQVLSAQGITAIHIAGGATP
ncbi:ExbD/TolR family protein [Paracoccus jiaweipingae]|uniref:ExbD/TolR family protein n=1 Tax=unclassified Paracoccus (in: a-proteobacteria) TaxID=2688777 RepID=UPI0037B0F5B9